MMQFYTANDISSLLDRFSKIKLDKHNDRMNMDYFETVQVIAKAIDVFLAEYEKPKKSVWLGLYGDEDE